MFLERARVRARLSILRLPRFVAILSSVRLAVYRWIIVIAAFYGLFSVKTSETDENIGRGRDCIKMKESSLAQIGSNTCILTPLAMVHRRPCASFFFNDFLVSFDHRGRYLHSDYYQSWPVCMCVCLPTRSALTSPQVATWNNSSKIAFFHVLHYNLISKQHFYIIELKRCN